MLSEKLISVVTAALIGAWNLVSVILEYALLISIYRYCARADIHSFTLNNSV
jgi:hypothetical protein